MAQGARRARRMVGGDVEQGAPARGQPRHVRAGAVVDQGQAYVEVRPADERGLEHGRAPVAGQQQRTAAGAGQVHAQRRGGAHGRVEVLLARGPAGVEDDERARVAVGAQPALHELAAARQSRPEDARRRGAGPVGPQAVEVDLGGDRRAPTARGEAAAVAVAGRRDDLLQARQDEQLGGLVGRHDPGGEAQRIADHDARRWQHLAPAPREARADVDLGAPAAADHRRRAGQQVVLDVAAGQRQPPARDHEVDDHRLLLDRTPRGHRALDVHAARGQRDPQRGHPGEHHQGHAGHVQRLGVEGRRGQREQEPEKRGDGGRAHAAA
jgi:hypothetical protein